MISIISNQHAVYLTIRMKVLFREIIIPLYGENVLQSFSLPSHKLCCMPRLANTLLTLLYLTAAVYAIE